MQLQEKPSTATAVTQWLLLPKGLWRMRRGGESSAHTFLIGRENYNSKGKGKPVWKRDNFLSFVDSSSDKMKILLIDLQQNWHKLVQKCPNWYEEVKTGPIWPKLVFG